MRLPASLLCLLPMVFLLLFASPAVAQEDDDESGLYPEANEKDWYFGVDAAAWYMRLDGDLRVDDKGVAVIGSQINLDTHLDVGMREFSGSVGAFFGYDEHRVDVDYFQRQFEGTTTLDAAIAYGGRTFVAGTPVTSEIETSAVTALYTYYFIWEPDIRLGPCVGMEWIQVDTEIRSPALKVSEDISVPAPVLGMRLEFDLHEYFSFRAEGRGMALGIQDVSGSIYDIRAVVEGHVTDNFSAYLGYRVFRIDFDADGGGIRAKGSAQLDGVIFGAQVRF